MSDMSESPQTIEVQSSPIRAPGVVVFSLLTALTGFALLWIGWVFMSGRFQPPPAIPKEVSGALSTMMGP